MGEPPDHFGPFVVLHLLGSGGMGEVYRSRDTRLNRDVAIKILTSAGSDQRRQRRFTDEAQAASALNHPNIVTVYDVGAQDGVPYIVSELVEGTTLRTVLNRAPLSTRDVLDVATQMADGLAAAHQAGIVHRDFKPENVMVTPEGRVKILDFGLARMHTGDAGSLEATVTQSVVIAGTVPYMSPEQIRGVPIDFRSDQFSLGLTLYEMVTGSRAFRADTAPQTMAAILEDEVEPIAKLNPRVPAPLRWTIERCLAKDPRQRYESTADLARELRMLRDRLAEFTSATDVTPPPVRTRWKPAVAIVAALLLLAAAGAVAARSQPGVQLDRYRFTPFATDAGYQGDPAWSPDGKTLAYVAAVDGVLQVFTKAIDSPLRAQVTHSRFDCREVVWGADGSRLYYVSLARDRDGLWTISAAGGEPEFVVENVSRVAMSPDGKTLALFRASENDYGGVYTLWLSTPPGSAPVHYNRPPLGETKFFDGTIRFTPDGSKLGLWGIRARAFNRPEFWILPLSGSAPYLAASVTVNSPSFAAPFSWLPDSRRLIAALPSPRPGVHLWLLDTGGVEPHLITAGGTVENDPAVSPDGARLAATLQQANYDIYKIALESAALEPVLSSSRNEMDPSWSTVTSQMAFTTDRSGSDEIWVRSASGDFERPLVSARDFPKDETYLLGSPSFSPDGQRVAYYREGASSNHVWVSPVAGGPPVEVSPPKIEQDLPTWSPDGNWIAFPQDGPEQVGLWTVMKVRLGTTSAPQVVVSDIMPLTPVKWSPNGEWIAFDGHDGLSIVAPDGSSARAIYDEPWLAFAWSGDSRRLFGIRQSDDLKHLTLTSIEIETGRERVLRDELMPMPIAARPVRGFTRISDTTFLTSIVRVNSDIWLLDHFTNAVRPWWQTFFARE